MDITEALVRKFNQNHDEKGRFSSSPSAGGGGAVTHPATAIPSPNKVLFKGKWVEENKLRAHQDRLGKWLANTANQGPTHDSTWRDKIQEAADIRHALEQRKGVITVDASGRPISPPDGSLPGPEKYVPPKPRSRRKAKQLSLFPHDETPVLAGHPEEKKLMQPIQEVLEDDNVGDHTAKIKKIQFEDGSYGIFKPDAGEPTEQMRRYVERGHQGDRELGAWEVAKVVGMDDIVSPVVKRTVKGRVGIIMKFQEGEVAKEAGYEERFDGSKDAARAAAFDFVIGNTDRHSGNWILDGDKLRLIDHSLAFPEEAHGSMASYSNYQFIEHAASEQLISHDPDGFPPVQKLAKPFVDNKGKIIEALKTNTKLPPDAIAGVAARIDEIGKAKSWTVLSDRANNGNEPQMWNHDVASTEKPSVDPEKLLEALRTPHVSAHGKVVQPDHQTSAENEKQMIAQAHQMIDAAKLQKPVHFMLDGKVVPAVVWSKDLERWVRNPVLPAKIKDSDLPLDMLSGLDSEGRTKGVHGGHETWFLDTMAFLHKHRMFGPFHESVTDTRERERVGWGDGVFQGAMRKPRIPHQGHRFERFENGGGALS